MVSSAAESVITLNTEPGSNGTDTAWLKRSTASRPGCGCLFGSKVGIARHAVNLAGDRIHRHRAARLALCGCTAAASSRSITN